MGSLTQSMALSESEGQGERAQCRRSALFREHELVAVAAAHNVEFCAVVRCRWRCGKGVPPEYSIAGLTCSFGWGLMR